MDTEPFDKLDTVYEEEKNGVDNSEGFKREEIDHSLLEGLNDKRAIANFAF